MVVRLGRGQCGGHITLFFTIVDDHKESINQGSLGAGLCLKDGIEVISRGEEGDFKLNIKFLNGNGTNDLYEDVIDVLSVDIPEIKNYSWELNIRFSLPTSQGFGMSASGAIAAASSFQRALGIPHEESKRRSYLVAHIIERRRSTGLGDTTALASGGVERRLSEGSPYSGNSLTKGPGMSEGWTEDIPLLLAWMPESGKHTSEYINNDMWKDKITNAGLKAMKNIAEGEWNSSRWKELLTSAENFAIDSELIIDSKRSIILKDVNIIIKENNLQNFCNSLLCMLGRSVVILPKDIMNPDFKIDIISKQLTEMGYKTAITEVSKLF
ncbi:hypothetical protein N8653_01635 [Euryarchaeota archaeon]|nr:hypothetical protein [Euryarchaeota archaeon]|tara:strand:- start:34654 stop:35631 length:978 start_codon:yes stop_codon:yes gene_type:complete